MKASAALRRPTLVRRMMATLLIAFALVWLVLLARELFAATDEAALAASAALVNRHYRDQQAPGPVLFALRDNKGQRLFWSSEDGAATLTGSAGPVSGAVVHGHRYRLYAGARGRWSLRVAVPVLPTSWLLKALGTSLTVDMLTAPVAGRHARAGAVAQAVAADRRARSR